MKRYISYPLILLTGLMFSLSSCSRQQSTLERLIGNLENQSAETLLDEYFTLLPDQRSFVEESYKDFFPILSSKVKSADYSLLPYKKAQHEYDKLAELTNENNISNIWVIAFGSDDFNYVLFEGDKIKSMLPIMKGEVIGGWL